MLSEKTFGQNAEGDTGTCVWFHKTKKQELHDATTPLSDTTPIAA